MSDAGELLQLCRYRCQVIIGCITAHNAHKITYSIAATTDIIQVRTAVPFANKYHIVEIEVYT